MVSNSSRHSLFFFARFETRCLPALRSVVAFKLNRAISGFDGGISDTYGLSAYDLAALMTQWRERATATPQRIT